MNWNVFIYDFNKKKIKVKNLFNISITFNEDFKALKDQILKGDITTKEEFADKLKSILMYTFWCRREYEIAISDLYWAYRDATDEMKVKEYEHYYKTAEKIDIYSQVEMNWDKFVILRSKNYGIRSFWRLL